MKIITSYQCEICKREYDNIPDATECEAKGIPDEKSIPIGLMYPIFHNGFVGIFALAKLKISDGHYLQKSSWASRTPKYSVGIYGGKLGSLSSSGGYITLEYFKERPITKELMETNEFKNMVSVLKINNITPSYYNEKGELIKI